LSDNQLYIKEGKQAVNMTRLSCHRFRSNEVRLWLSLIAYNLGNLWRRLMLPKGIDNWSLTSLQRRLVKTGGRLIKHARYYLVAAGGESSDTANIWRHAAEDRSAAGTGGIEGSQSAADFGDETERESDRCLRTPRKKGRYRCFGVKAKQNRPVEKPLGLQAGLHLAFANRCR
jgi:Transposase DDE domain group 1